MGGEGEGGRIGMREGGAGIRPINLLDWQARSEDQLPWRILHQPQSGGMHKHVNRLTQKPHIDKTEQLHKHTHWLTNMHQTCRNVHKETQARAHKMF